MLKFKVPQKILDSIHFPMLVFDNSTWKTKFIITKNNPNGTVEGYIDTQGIDDRIVEGIVMSYDGCCKCAKPTPYNKHILFKYHCAACGDIINYE